MVDVSGCSVVDVASVIDDDVVVTVVMATVVSVEASVVDPVDVVVSSIVVA